MSNPSLAELTRQFANTGKLIWIGLRPARGLPMLSVSDVFADSQSGLFGDRYQGTSGKRQVTLLQWEHLDVIASYMGKPVMPELLRRNLIIKGINLLALKNYSFQIGEAVFMTTGYCHPCSKIEKKLGTGGYNALRGHGGITAQIIKSGLITVGDALSVTDNTDLYG